MASINEFVLNVSGLVIYPVMAFALSLAFTAFCIKILPKLGFIDNPGGRHIHVRAVPRGGGIAVVLAVFLTMLAYVASSRDVFGTQMLKNGVLPGAVIFITGLIDDRIGLRSTVKLAAQIFAAVLIWYCYGRELMICSWVLPQYLSLIVTVLWVVGVINAFNMIDGLDGLATGLAAISGGFLTVWFLFRGNPMALYMLIFVGACLGFLRYNFSPGQIFLGDTGSMFLGMFLAVAGAETLDYTATFTSLLLPPLIVGVPLFDMILAVWRRSIRKKLNPGAAGVMDADSDHLHHRFLHNSGSHSRAAVRMYILSAFFALLAIGLLLMRGRAAGAAFVLLVLIGLVILRSLAVTELYDSVSFLRKRFSHLRKNLLFVAVHPLLDTVMVGGVAAVFSFVLLGRVSPKFVLYMTLPVMTVLIIAGTYRVFWLRAVMRDRIKLFVSVVAGSCAAVLIMYGFHTYKYLDGLYSEFLSGAVLFVLLSASLISFERFILYYIESAWINRFVSMCVPEKVERVLLVGSGFALRLGMMFFDCSQSANTMKKVIGVINDDPGVRRGQRCYGIPVAGKIAEIGEVFEKTPFDRVVILEKDLPKSCLQLVIAFCAGKKVACSFLSVPENGITPSDDIPACWTQKRDVPWLIFDMLYLLLVSVLSSVLLLGCVVWYCPVFLLILPVAFFAASGCYRIRNWRMADVNDRWKLLEWSLAGGVTALVFTSATSWYFYGNDMDWLHFLSGSTAYMLMLCGGMQLFRLFMHPSIYHWLCNRKYGSRRVLLVGGGLHCRLYLQCLAADHSANRPKVVGIVDDDDALHGSRCLGFPMLGGCDEIAGIFRSVPFDEIVVAGSNLSEESRRKVCEFCAGSGVKKEEFQVGETEIDLE